MSIESIVSILYLLSCLYFTKRAYEYFASKNNDGDPEGLDFLSAGFVGLFWPFFGVLYIFRKIIKRS